MLSPEQVKDAITHFEVMSPVFIALGCNMRQQILFILADAPIEGLNVSDITARMYLSQPAVSHHLKILKNAGLISSYKKATQIFYFLFLKGNLEKMKKLTQVLETLIDSVNKNTLMEEAPWMVCNLL